MSESSKESASAPLVRMLGVSRSFGPVRACDDVTLDVRAGEVHALIGENGAGKSTLMNILYGALRPDSGRIEVGGRDARFASPRDAIEAGIAMVPQQLRVLNEMTVAENLALLVPYPLRCFGRPWLPRDAAMRFLRQSGFGLDADASVASLSVGEKQRLEIARALFRDARAIILDEPTAHLAPPEVDGLFQLLARLHDPSRAIVFISHKLDEVRRIADRITVMRRGRVVARHDNAGVGPAQLAGEMIGEIPGPASRSLKRQPGGMLLDVRGLSSSKRSAGVKLDSVSFDVRTGEIFGIVGVAGNGQPQLVDALLGLRRDVHGIASFEGRDLLVRDPHETAEAGIAYLPQDVEGRGIVPTFDLAENVVLGRHRDRAFTGMLRVNRGAMIAEARRVVGEFGIRAGGMDDLPESLSGGNRQRLLVARVLSRQLKLLIAEQPTQGLDVAAAQAICDRLREVASRGAGVLLVSYDLTEALSVCDRIAVMFGGRLGPPHDAASVDAGALGCEMVGGAS